MTFTDGIFPSVIPLQSPTEYPSVITVEFYRRKYSFGNLVAGIIFFWRAEPSVYRRHFHRYFFLKLPIEIAME